jgi:hypothetical protein
MKSPTKLYAIATIGLVAAIGALGLAASSPVGAASAATAPAPQAAKPKIGVADGLRQLADDITDKVRIAAKARLNRLHLPTAAPVAAASPGASTARTSTATVGTATAGTTPTKPASSSPGLGRLSSQNAIYGPDKVCLLPTTALDREVVIGRRLRPLKIFFRLRLQNMFQQSIPTPSCGR